MKKIRTLLVDDETLAREGLMAMLAGDADIEVVGTCADGLSAVAAIKKLRPDLVFLDVQMPNANGFEVVAKLKPEERPVIIFVTAYDKHAVEAFEVRAVDYLVKPFKDARFSEALAKAKGEIRRGSLLKMEQKLEQLLGYVTDVVRSGAAAGPNVTANAEGVDRVVLKTGNDLNFTKTADIIWFESQADFVRVHTTGTSQMVRETLQSLEARVPPGKFLRIHRSSLVNLDHVKKVTPALYGDYTVLLSDNTQLRLSRRNRGKLKQLIARLSAAGQD